MTSAPPTAGSPRCTSRSSRRCHRTHLLWHRLGAKTLALIDEHIVAVEIRGRGVERLTVDEEMIEALRKLGLAGVERTAAASLPAPSAQEILDSIEQRIAAKLAEDPHNLTLHLAGRTARRSATHRRSSPPRTRSSSSRHSSRLPATSSLLSAALVEAGSEASSAPQLLPDDHIGALTQIFEEFKPEVTPEIIERVVKEIDAVVMGARFTDWQHSREGTRNGQDGDPQGAQQVRARRRPATSSSAPTATSPSTTDRPTASRVDEASSPRPATPCAAPSRPPTEQFNLTGRAHRRGGPLVRWPGPVQVVSKPVVG